jgi:hypothetical protein
MRPGGVRSVVAESLLLKHQLLTLKRSSKRAPKLTPWDRLLLGFGSACVSRARVPKIAIALKPSTLLRFHRALARLKYHLLYASRRRRQDNDLLIEVPTLKHGRAIATSHCDLRRRGIVSLTRPGRNGTRERTRNCFRCPLADLRGSQTTGPRTTRASASCIELLRSTVQHRQFLEMPEHARNHGVGSPRRA